MHGDESAFCAAVLAVYTGVAAIVGAFLAGLALGESTGQREPIWRMASRSYWCRFS